MISTGQVNVGTAVALIHDCTKWARLTIQNNDNTKTLYLGGAAVTSSTGLALLKQETIQMHLSPGEALYAVSTDAGGHVVSYLVQAP